MIAMISSTSSCNAFTKLKRSQKVAECAFTSSKSLANRIKIKYLKYFSIMFVMHIKQFPQFIPSSKRKYALEAIQLNLVFAFRAICLLSISSDSCDAFSFSFTFSFQKAFFLFLLCRCRFKTFFPTIADEEIICEKAKEMT